MLAPGATVTAGDLPPDVDAQLAGVPSEQTWQHLLEQAAAERFAMGQKDVLSEFGPDFERALLRTALGVYPGPQAGGCPLDRMGPQYPDP